MSFIEVQYIGGSDAILKYYENKYQAVPLFQCPAYVGKNGIGKTCEGDYKTPTGRYHFTMAFGMREKPDTHLKYVQITNQHYWCNDFKNYNKLINIQKTTTFCIGEHLIDYPVAYEFAIVLDYNKECRPGLGSAIFLHCAVPGHLYTAGCIAVDRAIMIKLLRLCDKQTEIWIH